MAPAVGVSSAAAAIAPPPQAPVRKILHVITDLLTGGAETALVTLVTAPHWINTTHHVVAMIPGGVNAQRLRDAGIGVTELGFRRGVPDPIQVWRLSRVIRAQRPDVIQSWMYHADLAALAALKLAGRSGRTKLVWGIRCSNLDASRYGRGFRFIVATAARLSRFPAAMTANSQAGIEFHKSLGYRPRRAEMIHNGIDVARFKPDPLARAELREELKIDFGAPVVALMARIDPAKDHEGFLSAMRMLPDIRAILAGEGTESLPDLPNIIRLGRRDDVPRLLAACDLIVSSSAFGEGFPNALAEGMAAGLAPVATDVGDSRLIVGDTGLVVPPSDPVALATAIRALVEEDPSSAMVRRRRARGRILERFSVERAVKLYAGLYAELDRAS
jgi:glycosyltransferase involved in cell wall biosynthesis